jgi:YesN/AraC family two-component response regulator
MSDYNLANLNVLVGDDYLPMRHIVKGILRQLKTLNVGEPENGRKALDLLRNFAADILITYSRMFPIDGLELAKPILAKLVYSRI